MLLHGLEYEMEIYVGVSLPQQINSKINSAWISEYATTDSIIWVKFTICL